MFYYRGLTFIEQGGDLVLIQPNRLILQSHIKLHAIIRLVDDHFSLISLGCVLPFIATIQAKMQYTLCLHIV